MSEVGAITGHVYLLPANNNDTCVQNCEAVEHIGCKFYNRPKPKKILAHFSVLPTDFVKNTGTRVKKGNREITANIKNKAIFFQRKGHTYILILF